MFQATAPACGHDDLRGRSRGNFGRNIPGRRSQRTCIPSYRDDSGDLTRPRCRGATLVGFIGGVAFYLAHIE